MCLLSSGTKIARKETQTFPSTGDITPLQLLRNLQKQVPLQACPLQTKGIIIPCYLR